MMRADAADPVTTGLAGSPHETLPEEGRLVIPWPIARLALTLGGNRFRARQRRHGDEDDAGWALKMRAAEERRRGAPRELDLPALAGHLQRSGLRDGLDEAIRSRPFISFLNASDSRV
jgi:hypothetical protein